jgi:hypothetical protein
VIAFQLFSGRAFYPTNANAMMIQRMLHGETQFAHEANDAVFGEMGRWATIVRGMLHRDMHERLSIQDVVGMLTDVHR